MSLQMNESSLFQLPSMLHCSERLKTFDSWCEANKPCKVDMAKAGFIFLGFEDQTICVFCGIRIHKWTPHDVPFVEHKKYSWGCPFLKLTYVEEPVKTKEVTQPLFASGRNTQPGQLFENKNNEHLFLGQSNASSFSLFQSRKPTFNTFGYM